MFDTAIIYKTFTRKTVNLIINRLKALICRQRYFKSGRVRIFPAKHELQKYGVKYIAIVNQPDDTYVNVYISFSLQGLCSGDSEHLFQPSDNAISLLKNNFDRLMKELGIVQGTDIEAWTFSRLDCAVEVETPYADLYVQLMKKAKQPYHYKLLCNKAGSLYSGTKKRTTVFNHYNKTAERSSRGIHEDQGESIPTLRLEVQIKSTRKLRDLKKRHGLKEDSLLDFLRKDIAQDVIERHDKRFGLTGDYVSMAEANLLINASSKQRRTKERMISFLKIVTKYQNVNAACQLYEAETGKSSTDLIRAIRDLGINPVTIPFIKNIKRLPGIISLVEEVFDKLEAKNQVYQDKNSLFPRNGNNVETLHSGQLLNKEVHFMPALRAITDGLATLRQPQMCIYVNVIGKHININGAERGIVMIGPFYSGENKDERQGFAEHRGPP